MLKVYSELYGKLKLYKPRHINTAYVALAATISLKKYNLKAKLTVVFPLMFDNFLQVILFEMDSAIFYTNLHPLFCQFIS